jgi:hypothetical protein
VAAGVGLQRGAEADSKMKDALIVGVVAYAVGFLVSLIVYSPVIMTVAVKAADQIRGCL